jgi:endo-1,4-beta-D-glucanase Y
MRKRIFLGIFFCTLIYTSLPAMSSPQELALSFVREMMTVAGGGICGRYILSPGGKDDSAGCEILLQGSGLLLLYAALTGDRALFEDQLQVIQEYFLDEKLGLLYWKLDEEMAPVPDPQGTYANSAGDSLRVVRALLVAYERWGEERYRGLALRIAEALKRYNVAPDGALRSFVSWNDAGEVVSVARSVVLSHLDLPAMASLVQIDADWDDILATNFELALSGMSRRGLFYEAFFPAENVYRPAEGNMIHMTQVALHLALYGEMSRKPLALSAARSFLFFVKTEYERKGIICGRYDPESGRPKADWENITVYALTAQLAAALGDLDFAERLLAEKIIALQRLSPDSPVYGGFALREQEAYALDTLEAMLALAVSRRSTPGPDEFIRLVWYLGWKKDSYLWPSAAVELLRIRNSLCANYIGLFAIVYQNDRASTDPHRDPEHTASDEALRYVISLAHQLGMGVVLLTPLIPLDGTWEGAILPSNLDLWFSGWRRILIHYAELAEETGVEILLLGSELVTLRRHSEKWRELITAVRDRFSGRISYSVNFWANREAYEEVLAMSHWADLDYIGVTGYFELTEKRTPTLEELKAAWRRDRNGQDVIADLETLHRKYGKPIVFWEIGYQSKDGTNIYPWNYPRPGGVDEMEQVVAWRAFLEVFRERPWFKGFGIYAEHVGLPPNPLGYNVLGKLAEKVFREVCGSE